MAYMGPAFNTFDVNFNFSDLVLDAGDVAENGDLLQYDLANAQWLTVSNLTIPGDLIVNGTTTTVNSTTVTIDDPIFTLGGDVAPTITDALDRGIEFRWHDGVNAKTGFFGFDNGTGSFTFIPDATNTNEVFTGTPGSVNFYDANFSGNTAIKIPVGGTADRPTALQGQLRYNTDLNQFEGYDGSNWAGLGGIIDADQDTYIDAEQTADDDTLRFYTGGVERMTIDGTGTINFNGGLELGLQETVTGDLSTTATTQVTLDSWPTTSYRSAKYMLQAIDKISNEYHVSELMVIHNSSTAFATEYGTIHTGSSPLASYDVDVDSNNVRLRTTPASANFTNFKFTRNALTPEPTFALSASSSNINEGDSVTITLTTTHVSNNNQFAYTVTGVDSSDLSAGSLTGVFTINNNTATTSFTLANDATTEGSETLTLALDNGQANVGVVIGDTSLDPTYTLSADNTTINEGDTVTITLTTTDVPDATTVAYTVTGVNTSDLSAGTLTGNFTITSNTGTVQFTLAEDATTEGVETLTLALDNGGDSINISITDTSADSTTQDYVADDYVVDGFVTSPAAGSTGTIDSATGSLGMQVGSSNSQWFEFNGDGTALFVHNVGSGSLAPAGHLLNKYTVSTPYDLTTATYSNNEYYGSGNDYEGKFSGDGMRFYYNSGGGWMHNLASAYEPGNNIRGPGAQSDGVGPGGESWCFSHDGMKLYTLAKSNIPNGVVYSEGTTAWDTTTFSLPGGALTGNTFNYGNEMTGASNIEMNSTGTKLYIYTRYSTITGAPVSIVEYDFGTPYDITTLTYNGKYLNVGSDGFQSAERISFRLENDNLIFVKGPNTNHSGNDAIYQYTIPTQGTGGSSSYYGSRAWATGGRTGDTTGYAGYNNTVHLSIPTQSNSTQTQDIFSYPSAVGFQASGVRGSTCLVVGGSNTGNTSITDIRNFDCATLGASVSHGSLTPVFTNGEDGFMNNGSLSDADRCVFQAGFDAQTASHLNTMGYVSIQNAGDAADFGNLTQSRRGTTSSNDSTRGLFVGGEPSATSGSNRIDYITIQTAGDATDFGDYNYSVRAPASTSDATITIVSGGRWAGSSATMYNTYCGYVTIQTPGNASSFGNLQNARRAHMMSSDGTYAVTWGGRKSGTPSYTLASEYQVFATQGNATEFSELGNYALYEGGHGSGNAS